MTRKSGKHLHAKHWTAVSTLLGLISSTHRDLHHWRSNQQPQYAEAETLPLGRRFMPHISNADSPAKKIPAAAVNKEGNADSTIDFLEKGASINGVSYCHLFSQLYWMNLANTLKYSLIREIAVFNTLTCDSLKIIYSLRVFVFFFFIIYFEGQVINCTLRKIVCRFSWLSILWLNFFHSSGHHSFHLPPSPLPALTLMSFICSFLLIFEIQLRSFLTLLSGFFWFFFSPAISSLETKSFQFLIPVSIVL